MSWPDTHESNRVLYPVSARRARFIPEGKPRQGRRDAVFSHFLVHLLAKGLGLSMFDLGIQPALSGGKGRLGGAAFLPDYSGLPDHLGQTVKRLFPVFFQAAEFLGFDDDLAVSCQALIAHGKEPNFVAVWQG
jgi:hypothetical protein